MMAIFGKEKGAPVHYNLSAHGHQAKHSLTRPVYLSLEIAKSRQQSAFRRGLLIGLSVSATVFALILWLWVIPTMEAAVQAAQGLIG